jgi:hypothetical protein
MEKDCRLEVPPKEPKHDFNNHAKGASIIWIRKSDNLNVDSGCLKHMIGDKNIFITLNKERDGSISFGNDNSTKIIGKGTMKLGIKDVEEENVLLFENMKHNMLSLSQMCDHGHRLIFDSENCEIRK